MEKLMVIGWANIGLIAFILVVNFYIMSYETVKMLIMKVKRCCYKFKY